MQTHKLCWCCSIMQGYITDGIVTVNVDAGTANLNAINVPTPIDDDLQMPEMTRIPISYCPNCGEKIIVYAENVPAPTYTRAELTGASCNDVTCSKLDRTNLLCGYQYRTNGRCLSTSDEEKQAYSDLRSNVQKGWGEMTSEG